MELYYSPASPFARKVLVIALETGQKVTPIQAAANPVQRNETLGAANPLAKIPAALLDDGSVLYDSRVICQYLDSNHDGAAFYPAPGPARWTAMRREALADGLMDAAILSRYETAMRPEALRWQEWVDGQMGKILAALDAFEAEADAGTLTGLDAGLVALGCALGYLDFRFASFDWREGRPALSNWFRGFSERQSMQATLPTA